MLEINDQGMTDSEHRLCRWETPQSDGDHLRNNLVCGLPHTTQSGLIMIRETNYNFSASLVSPETLQVDYADGRGPALLYKCDNRNGANDG